MSNTGNKVAFSERHSDTAGYQNIRGKDGVLCVTNARIYYADEFEA